MIPYVQQPSFHLFGPVTIHTFGFFVAVAGIVGSKMALMRCQRRKMDPADPGPVHEIQRRVTKSRSFSKRR